MKVPPMPLFDGLIDSSEFYGGDPRVLEETILLCEGPAPFEEFDAEMRSFQKAVRPG